MDGLIMWLLAGCVKWDSEQRERPGRSGKHAADRVDHALDPQAPGKYRHFEQSEAISGPVKSPFQQIAPHGSILPPSKVRI
jgi:hypothetical protein